jgi:hypothetical protein
VVCGRERSAWEIREAKSAQAEQSSAGGALHLPLYSTFNESGAGSPIPFQGIGMKAPPHPLSVISPDIL